MNYLKCCAALAALMIAGCGGGGTAVTTGGGTSGTGGGGVLAGPVPVTTTTSNFVAPNGVAIDGVAFDGLTIDRAIGLSNVMQFVTVNGNVRPLARGLGLPPGIYSDGSSTFYTASFSSQGNSSALAGWRSSTIGVSNFVGGFAHVIPGASLSGSANYSGAYTGFMADDPTFGQMTGRMAVSADFDAGTFTAQITGRRLGPSSFTTLFDLGAVQADVGFGGTIDGRGIFHGGHDDGNSVGSLGGMAHPDGVLGVVELTHTGGGGAFSPIQNPVEVGTFNAE